MLPLFLVISLYDCIAVLFLFYIIREMLKRGAMVANFRLL
mgnify:CR=1 FL=1